MDSEEIQVVIKDRISLAKLSLEANFIKISPIFLRKVRGLSGDIKWRSLDFTSGARGRGRVVSFSMKSLRKSTAHNEEISRFGLCIVDSNERQSWSGQ